MPDVSELQEELVAARADIQEAINDQPELENQSKFLMEVLAILENKLAQEKDLNALSKEGQISILAHLNLFYSLLEDIFGDDMDFDDEDLYDFDEEDEDDEELEDEEENDKK